MVKEKTFTFSLGEMLTLRVSLDARHHEVKSAIPHLTNNAREEMINNLANVEDLQRKLGFPTK